VDPNERNLTTNCQFGNKPKNRHPPTVYTFGPQGNDRPEQSVQKGDTNPNVASRIQANSKCVLPVLWLPSPAMPIQ
jgi:hypothetical protein